MKDKLKHLSALEKIIAINVVVYFTGWLVYQTQGITREDSLNWLALPKDFLEFILKPWSILTYGFAHTDFWHLFLNMLVLYFVGRSFTNLFSINISLNVYFLGILLGILFGGLSFILVYALFPNGILNNVGDLVGASAGVRASLIFLCAYMPNREMRLGTIGIRLMYIGIAFVALDFLGLFGDNPGGYVSHLGGDTLGYFYAVQLQKGTDMGKGFGRFMDSITNFFSKGKTANLRTVHKSKKKSYAGHTKQEFSEFNNQRQIDIILDKISKSGYESLSKEEKAFLFKAGKK